MPNTLDKSYLETSVFKPQLFANKVVFVTGGAGTICRVQTEAMVLLGADACIVGRNQHRPKTVASEIEQLRPGARVLGIGNTDVSQIEPIIVAVKLALEKLGRIDFVIAGAAGNFLAPVTSLSSNGFRRVVEIDLIGAFNTAKATLNELRRTSGHILFVSATLQLRGVPLQTHASAAKAGIDSLVRSLAVELGPLNIQVNGIAPGPISATEGFSKLLPSELALRSQQLVPLQRFGTTTDVANATVYLFSPAANFISGHVLVIDGAAWLTSGAEMEGYPQLMVSMNSKVNKL